MKSANIFKRLKKLVPLLLFIAIPTNTAAAPNDPEEFSNWFIKQGFQGEEYYQWAAVFEALIDGKDRSREIHYPVVESVYVAIITGDKYHTTEKCYTLLNSSFILEMDISEAQERGFEKCSRCE